MAKIIHTNVGVGIETLEEWMDEDIHELTEDGDGNIVPSFPPSGFYKITNMYMYKVGAKFMLRIFHKDTPEP